MKSYMVIEPQRFNRIHMNHLSPIYKFYHHQLKDASSDQEAADLTKDFCFSYTHTKLEDQLAVLEFLYMNDYFEELTTALQWSHLHPDIVTLYRIVLERKTVPLTEKDLRELEQIRFEHPSLQCIHLFLLVYAHFDMKKYAGMDKYTDEIHAALFKINEPLFHYYMKLRFDELTFHHYWKTNSLILAKKFAYKYIQTGLAPRKRATMHHNLALCHAFEDYSSAIHYATKALQISEDHDLTASAREIKHHTIPFLSAYHQRPERIYTHDPVEQAHLAISRGDVDTGIEILTSLERLSSFQESYLGLATKDVAMLRNAKERFIKENGDYFFAQLPENYIKRIVKIV
ncbi:hypothetical protein EQV77_15660 [Halobacillus fulvus]|nr:hypothetical protein EQV77_15660 [Halobacillus fulvus]